MVNDTERSEASYFLLCITSMCAAQASSNPWLLAFSICLGVLMFRWFK